jgi:ABC-type lipoprotein release transport system permease subunit
MGVIVGTGLAMLLRRSLQATLFGVTPMDPLAVAAGASAMVIVVLAASWVPARRACRVDPMVALRHE